MFTADFDYHLPPSLIAQAPAQPRESARLLVMDRGNGSLVHRLVTNLDEYFRPGDLMVVNNTKVFPARLYGHTGSTTRPIELFLIRPTGETTWQTLAKPGKKLTAGTTVFIVPGFTARILHKFPDGTLTADFGLTESQVIALATSYGQIPVPPYIKSIPPENDYQTAYAKIIGSVAAPTAGFHLTPNLLTRLAEKGIGITQITLHVGLGTFLPVKTTTLESHLMHSERVEITGPAAAQINQAKLENRRIIAVGTTTVRTLEGVTAANAGQLTAYKGEVNLFIKPGFTFRVINGLLTNFHLPKSTLLALVSAFAGREKILTAYSEAIARDYRFYSFGDAMFIS